MDLILPTNQNTSAPVTLDTKVLVVIGANGAGKSSFGRNLHQRYAGQSVWISGMHSLFLSSEENKTPVNGNELTRLQSMIAERLFIPRMSEYEKLILHLQTEEFEAAVQYKEESKLTPDLLPPVTKIDRIQTIWEKMFPHNRLVRKSGFIELASTSIDGDSYTAGRMSDGEKLVFYLIGAVLCAPDNALLIIEEPEVLLHDSIKNPLWDEVEAMRPDCTYVYLTHDIDFAYRWAERVHLLAAGRGVASLDAAQLPEAEAALAAAGVPVPAVARLAAVLAARGLLPPQACPRSQAQLLSLLADAPAACSPKEFLMIPSSHTEAVDAG